MWITATALASVSFFAVPASPGWNDIDTLRTRPETLTPKIVLVSRHNRKNGCQGARCEDDADGQKSEDEPDRDPKLVRLENDLASANLTIGGLSAQITRVYAATLEPLERERDDLRQRFLFASSEANELRQILEADRNPPLSDEIRADLQSALDAAIEDRDDFEARLQRNLSDQNTPELARAAQEINRAHRAISHWEAKRNLVAAELSEYRRLSEIAARDRRNRSTFAFYAARAGDATYVARTALQEAQASPNVSQARVADAERALNRAETIEASLKDLRDENGADATFAPELADLDAFLSYEPPVIRLPVGADAQQTQEARDALWNEELRGLGVLQVLLNAKQSLEAEIGAIEFDLEELRLEMEDARTDNESLALAGQRAALTQQSREIQARADFIGARIDALRTSLSENRESVTPAPVIAIDELGAEGTILGGDLLGAFEDAVSDAVEEDLLGADADRQDDDTAEVLQEEVLRLERILVPESDPSVEALALSDDPLELLETIIDQRRELRNLFTIRELRLELDLDQALNDEGDLARAQALDGELDQLGELIEDNLTRLRLLADLASIWPS